MRTRRGELGMRGFATIVAGLVVLAQAFLLVGCEEGPGTKSESDRRPSFGSRTIGNQTYTAGSTIDAFVLPAATGGNSPLTYSLAPSVPGLQFTAATRTLSGTPTEAKIHSMTYRVVDSDGDAATLTFALVVTEPAPLDTEPSFGTQRVPNQTYTAGTAITPLVLPAATGGNSPLTYSLAPSVPGLQFTAATRTLSGTPTEAKIHSMTYRVVDSDGDAATLTFALVVTEPAPLDTEPSFGTQRVPNQTYTAGTAITPLVLPAATGGNSPLTYGLAPNVPGLQFTPAIRTLSGTPTEAGTHSMTYRVLDRDGDPAIITFSIQIIVAEPEPEPEPERQNDAVPHCLGVERDRWALQTTNVCDYWIFVAYCAPTGTRALTGKHCGDNRQESQPYYTHGTNMRPGITDDRYRPHEDGAIHYAVCRGTDNRYAADWDEQFVSDEQGNYECYLTDHCSSVWDEENRQYVELCTPP